MGLNSLTDYIVVSTVISDLTRYSYIRKVVLISVKATRVSEFKLRENPHGVDARTIYDHESAQAVHITLMPGEEMKRHITPVDVFFFVLEGRGKVEIGGEIQVVDEDTIIESPAMIPHRLMNDSDAVFRFLVVKAPRPAKKS